MRPTLSRLQYRAPPAPITFHSHSGRRLTGELLEKRVTAFVNIESNSRPIRLQVVSNPKARRPATGQAVVRPTRPLTLKDIVAPDRHVRAGEIIYIFRNIKTNQIIYSLREQLNNRHLDQLPFMGRHSKPPVLRPDEWAPHCVLTFPAAEQGHNALKKLREFRKLHEVAWQTTNPEWKRIPRALRMKKIMDQRANTAADIARVLELQEADGAQRKEASRTRREWEVQILADRWAHVHALVDAANAKEKETDDVKYLEHQIKNLTQKLKMKHYQNEADQQRLKSAKNSVSIRLRKIQWAQRMADLLKTKEEELKNKAAPAKESGAEDELDELKVRASVLRQAVAKPDPTLSAEHRAMDQDTLKEHEAKIAVLEEAFEAKAQAENRSHDVYRAILPHHVKNPLPTPHTLDGVRVQWADIRDALAAADKWPEQIEHEELPINQSVKNVAFLSVEDFEMERAQEVGRILEAINPARRVEPEAELVA